MPNWTPEQLADYNRRNKAAIRAADKGMNDRFDISLPPSKFKALPLPTPKRKPLLNKTETRFLNILKADHPLQYIGIQNLTFCLAHDLRYTPDFWMVAEEEGECMTFWEVKGPFIREDSMVKLKTAATMFKMFQFVLAQESKDGQWTTKTIPPL